MNNLFNLAKGGLGVAQAFLRVTGDNMTNSMSSNYSRRSLIVGEMGGMSTSQGFFGYGAEATGVERAYNAFTNKQLRGSISGWSALNGRMEQLSDIDNMLADESDNVSVSMNDMFKKMADLSANTEQNPNRSEVFNSLGTLASRFNASGKRLDGLEKSTNSQIELSVKDINSYTKQLAELNKQLERAQGNGTPPADLLDQRDALLEGLSEHFGITVAEDPISGRVDVTMADGRPLVSGDTAYALQTSPSDADPNKIIVSYVDANGNASALDESSVTKGRLGGLFKFRNEDLVIARQELDQIAFMLASRMNEQNKQGYTPGGNAGGDLFSLPDITAVANAKNTGTGKLGAITVTDYKNVKGENYTLTSDGAGGWTVTGADGRTIPAVTDPAGNLTFDGVQINVTGAGFAAGDSFTFNPMAGAAEGISRKIISGDELAVAGGSDAEKGDNENLLKMLEIQNEKLIGDSTLTEAYASLVGTIGDRARAVKSEASSAERVLHDHFEEKQDIAGVNLDEETINMNMYMQYYNANAQILKTATTLFDSLLAIR